MTRRNFVTAAAAAASSYQRILGANERISVAHVGPGQRGRSLMRDFKRFADTVNAEYTGVCDIFVPNRERAAAQMKEWFQREIRQYATIDECLADKSIDAVIISTPDFAHSIHLAKAARAGKDVYCEKPMATVLEEGKDAVRAVRENKRVVQIGTQRRSEGRYKRAVELAKTGVMGTVTYVDIHWNVLESRWRRRDVKEVTESNTNWKEFLLNKDARPFDPHLHHEWRLYKEFSSGIPAQWMVHQIDAVTWILGDPYPKSCVASGGVYYWKDGRDNFDVVAAIFEFPKGWQLNYASRLTNSYGGVQESIFGTEASMDTTNWKITSQGTKSKAPDRPIEPLDDEHHMKNWLDCLRSRKDPNATVEDGLAGSVSAIMAVESYTTGRRVEWDPQRQRIV